MNPDAQDVIAQTRKVVVFQLGVAAVAAAGAFWINGVNAAQGTLFGVLTSMVSALSLSWGVVIASRRAVENRNRGMLILYVGAVQRFLLVLAMFGLGVGVLKLNPLFMVIGFGLAQFAFLAIARGAQPKT